MTDSADAGAASLAAPSGIVADVLGYWNVPAPVETDYLHLLQGCVVRDDSFVDGPEFNGGVMTGGDRASPGVWCRERTRIQNDLACQYVDCVCWALVGMDYAVPADGYTCSFGTLLSGPVCPLTDDMTYHEKLEAQGGDIYDYDDGVDSQPGSFDFDEPQDYEEWCDWNDPDVAEVYYDPPRLDVEGGFVFPWIAFGEETDTVVAASVVSGAEGVDSPISELLDLYGDFVSGPETAFPWSEDMLDVPDFWSTIDAGPGRPLPESGDMSELPDSISDVDPGNIAELPDCAVDSCSGLWKFLMTSRDTFPDGASDGAEVRQLSALVRPELRCVFDQGPGVYLSESGTRFGMPGLIKEAGASL